MSLKISLNTIKNQYPNGVQPDKQITGFRSILSNIDDINNNYNIDGGLTLSDVHGRMYFREFAQWTTEPQQIQINILLKKGFYKGIKLFPVLRGEGLISKKTRILDLKATGVAGDVRDLVLDHVRKELNGI